MPATKKKRSKPGRNGRAHHSSLLLYAAASMGFVAASLLSVLLISALMRAPREMRPQPEPSAASLPAAPATGAEPAPGASAAPEAASVPAAPATGAEPAPGASAAPKPAAGQPAAYRPPETRPALPQAPPPRSRAKTLIFVLDDAGHNLRELRPFLELPFPLTVAVLPGLPHSEEAARLVLAAGKELILHQPMEALGGADPGPRALYLSDAPDAATRLLEDNLASLPGAIGINNHMGSAVTRDPLLMGAVLAVAKRRGIYYLDSLTAPDTATGTVAARERIRYWERDVFLDNSPDRVSIIRYIDEGKKKAEKGGPAVMIGHVWSAELAETLSELYPQLVEEGFSLSTISRFMLEEADARTRD